MNNKVLYLSQLILSVLGIAFSVFGLFLLKANMLSWFAFALGVVNGLILIMFLFVLIRLMLMQDSEKKASHARRTTTRK